MKSSFRWLAFCSALCLASFAFASPQTPNPIQIGPAGPIVIYCQTGWCSSDAQCATWHHDSSAICVKSPGARCGHCALF